MKKKCSLLLAIVLIASTTLFAQKKEEKKEAKKDTTTTPQVFRIEGDINSFQFLLYTLDNPDKALHKDVKALMEWITSQLQKQIPVKEQPKNK